jgi:hypothetical protein
VPFWAFPPSPLSLKDSGPFFAVWFWDAVISSLSRSRGSFSNLLLRLRYILLRNSKAD